MATWIIQVPREQYTSLQIGDFICYIDTYTSVNYESTATVDSDGNYSQTPDSTLPFFTVGQGGTLQKLGTLSAINNTTSLDDGTETTTLTMQTNVLNYSTILPEVGSFAFFVKDDEANIASLLGYFAKVQLKNNSKEKAELFTISAEINESSK
tara:strand:+ start:284 stop:742 length:459 start_codon:yes stop_codon:yes gene_type:complete